MYIRTHNWPASFCQTRKVGTPARKTKPVATAGEGNAPPDGTPIIDVIVRVSNSERWCKDIERREA